MSGIVEVLDFMQKGQDHITKLLSVFPWKDLVIVLSTEQQRKAVGKMHAASPGRLLFSWSWLAWNRKQCGKLTSTGPKSLKLLITTEA